MDWMSLKPCLSSTFAKAKHFGKAIHLNTSTLWCGSPYHTSQETKLRKVKQRFCWLNVETREGATRQAAGIGGRRSSLNIFQNPGLAFWLPPTQDCMWHLPSLHVALDLTPGIREKNIPTSHKLLNVARNYWILISWIKFKLPSLQNILRKIKVFFHHWHNYQVWPNLLHIAYMKNICYDRINNSWATGWLSDCVTLTYLKAKLVTVGSYNLQMATGSVPKKIPCIFPCLSNQWVGQRKAKPI